MAAVFTFEGTNKVYNTYRFGLFCESSTANDCLFEDGFGKYNDNGMITPVYMVTTKHHNIFGTNDDGIKSTDSK